MSMDLHDGTPYWLLAHGLGPPVPPLDRDIRCDAAIIGGGITGALIADELTSRGLSTTLLDRRDLGTGSTIASTALLTYDLDTPLFKLIPTLGLDPARRAFRIGIEAIDRLDELCRSLNSPLERRASLYYTAEPGLDELAREHKARQDAGLPVQWLPRADLLAHLGLSATAAIRSDSAAQLDPYRLCHLLLRRAIDRGAAVHDRTTITARDLHTGRITLRTDRGPIIDAAHVIHATGYEAVCELPPGLVSLHSTYALVTEPTAPPPGLWPDRDMLWEFADPYLYARWAGDRLLIGGEDEPFGHPAARDRLIPDKTRALIRKFSSIMPGLTPEPAYAWTGTFASTADGLPCIGPRENGSRELYALGFGGNGIVAAASAARIIADHITGRHNPDADLFRLDRPTCH
ncbi:MAG: FAD-binding oxidoreductase [Phycisphaerales bacterium]|nr:FAD-binding oxidoreductase [Phycisphaerales bacterium]